MQKLIERAVITLEMNYLLKYTYMSIVKRSKNEIR